MVEPQKQKETAFSLSSGAKIVACSVGGFLLSIGLCAVGGGPDSYTHFLFLSTLGTVLFIASIVGLLVGVLMVLLALLEKLLRR